MIYVTDRINGNPVSQAEVKDFQKCIADTGLGQLNRKGCQWSWCNKREDADRIYNNIDWAFENSHWFMKYIIIEVVYKSYGVADHSPKLLCTEVIKNFFPKPFRLLNVILQDEVFNQMVQEVFNQTIPGYSMYSVWKKL